MLSGRMGHAMVSHSSDPHLPVLPLDTGLMVLAQIFLKHSQDGALVCTWTWNVSGTSWVVVIRHNSFDPGNTLLLNTPSSRATRNQDDLPAALMGCFMLLEDPSSVSMKKCIAKSRGDPELEAHWK